MNFLIAVPFLLAAAFPVTANHQVTTTVIQPGDPVPPSQRPAAYEHCRNVVRNGDFQDALNYWSDNSGGNCTTISNDGSFAFSPVGFGNIQVNFPPIVSKDALTVPLQGQGVEADCSLQQQITFTPGSAILYAQLSWVDRITTQTNKFDDDQFAEINVCVKGTNNVAVPIFTTTNANTDSSQVRRRFRKTEITSLLGGMTVGGVTALTLSLDQLAFDGPMYFQWDNVELWVCTAESPPDPESGGDPHFKTWSGEKFSYHGACDLVLLRNDAFNNGLGIDIQIRTKHRRDFSFIESAALRIGDEVLEVSGAGKPYYLNGVVNSDLSGKLAGFKVTMRKINTNQQVFLVDIGKGQHVVIKSWKDFVSVKIEGGSADDFGKSDGLMGSFYTGLKLARDGETVIDDWNSFGQEWQVQGGDERLFQKLESSQTTCTLPPPIASVGRHRRLGESISETDAAKACAHVSSDDRDFCIFDVISTNDADAAFAY